MGQRNLTIAVILPLLAALLSQSLAPHPHASHTGAPLAVGDAEAGLVVGAADAGQQSGPSATRLDAGECLACHSAKSSRAAIAGANVSFPPEACCEVLLLRASETPFAASRLARDMSPPRAPPVHA